MLKVHAQVSPDEYCQAHAPLAAVLLMQMPAEPAFWCLKAICDKYVPGYYAPGLVSVWVGVGCCFGVGERPLFIYSLTLFNHYSPLGVFTRQEAIQVDGDILYKLLKKVSPSAYKHLVSNLW